MLELLQLASTFPWFDILSLLVAAIAVSPALISGAVTTSSSPPEEPAPSPTSAPPPHFWTNKELAGAMRVSLATLFRLAAAGKIGPAPLRLSAACVRYRADECREWLSTSASDGRLPDRRAWAALKAARPARR